MIYKNEINNGNVSTDFLKYENPKNFCVVIRRFSNKFSKHIYIRYIKNMF